MQLMENRQEELAHHHPLVNCLIMVRSHQRFKYFLGCDAVCVFFGLVSFMQATTSGTTWMGLAVGFSLTVINLICI
jgi:hypothetical protein